MLSGDTQGTAAGSQHRYENLFVTGRPGVGKTTLIEKVLAGLDVRIGGFCTREIREGGRRVGFSIENLRGESGVLAHVDLRGVCRVGRYGVNRDDLERIGIPAIVESVEDAQLVVMDEIGRMELCSPDFRKAVELALDSPKPVFGTIQDRKNPFLDGVRARPDTRVLRVTEDNRDSMVDTVLAIVRRIISCGGR